MKESFVLKVVRELIVDTERYRYVYEVSPTGARITRLPLWMLGTAACLDTDNIVVVKEWGDYNACR